MSKKNPSFDPDIFDWTIHSNDFHRQLTQKHPLYLKHAGPVTVSVLADGSIQGGPQKSCEMIAEISGILSLAVTLWMDEQLDIGERHGGRPPDVVTPFLGSRLLPLYLEYNEKAGRHSLQSVGNTQIEGGPFLEFIQRAIEPLNQYFSGLPKQYGARQISAAQVARRALSDLARRQGRSKRRQAARGFPP